MPIICNVMPTVDALAPGAVLSHSVMASEHPINHHTKSVELVLERIAVAEPVVGVETIAN